MKKVLLTGMMVCLTASAALASGLNINRVTNATGNCGAAISNMTWDCTIDNPADANAGDMSFVISAVPAFAVVGFEAVDAVIDVQTDGATPAWWQSFNEGSCRQTGFAVELPPNTPAAPCAGTSTTKLYSAGTPQGGMGLWANLETNRLRVKVGFGVASKRALALITTTQYNIFHMHVYTTNSLEVIADPDNSIEGVVACAGCAVPATLVLQQVGLWGDTTDNLVTVGTIAGNQQHIDWQGGASAPVPVSTRNTTWGQVKSLYR